MVSRCSVCPGGHIQRIKFEDMNLFYSLGDSNIFMQLLLGSFNGQDVFEAYSFLDSTRTVHWRVKVIRYSKPLP